MAPYNKPGNAKSKSTSVTMERLIAKSVYSHVVNVIDSVLVDTTSLLDTANYRYSGDRSSKFNYNFMVYDNIYPINGANMFGFASRVGLLGRNATPTIMCDAGSRYAFSPFTFSLQLYNTQYASYDANNNITVYADIYPDSGIYQNTRYYNSFTTDQKVVNSLQLAQNALFSYDTMEYRSFVYDAFNKLVADSTNYYFAGTWNPYEKWTYNYDLSDNMIGANFFLFDEVSRLWTNPEKYVFTYTTANKLKTATHFIDSSFGWVPYLSDSFGYTTGIDYATYEQVKNYGDSGKYEGKNIIYKHIGTGSLPDTVFTNFYGSADTIEAKQFETFAYDGYQQPIKGLLYLYKLDSTLITGTYDTTYSIITHYYYQTYTTGIHDAGMGGIAVNTAVNISPNPTTGLINIDIEGGTQSKTLLIETINAAGQLLRTEQITVTGNGAAATSLQSLPAGAYVVTVRDSEGRVLGSNKVMKM